jgi:acyl-CoA thioester hydrolase
LPLPTTAQVRQLPRLRQATIGPEYLDAMGHMNIRWYMAFYDETAWAFAGALGMDIDYFQAHHSGVFALQHHIRYLAEVMPGDEIAIHGRLLGVGPKRFHWMGFMLNETHDRLASTIEAVVAHADMRVRRIAPFPPELAARLNKMLAEHTAIDWQPPLSGIMSP